MVSFLCPFDDTGILEPVLTVFRKFFIPLFAAASLWSQVYEGPAILSRGGSAGSRPFGERLGRQTKIRTYVDLSAVYDTGFLPYALDSNGNLQNPGALYGAEAGVGVFGIKKFRYGSFGIDYRGTFRRYSRNNQFAGSDHFLGIDAKQQISRRTTIEGHVTGGTSNRVFSFGSFLIGNSFATTLPINEVFDNRVYYLQGGASITFQPTARFSYVLGADAFGIRRSTGQLIGVNGYMPRAGIGYRLSKRLQLGGIYQFQHFDYPRAFGESDVHVVSGVLGYEFSRRWSAEFSLGLFRSDSAGTRRVAADPIIREILGIDSVVESFARGTTRAMYSAVLNGRFKKAGFTTGYSRTPGGGNGLVLLAVGDTFMANLSYSANRRFSFGTTSSLTRTTSISNDVGGTFKTYFSGGSANYFLTRSIGINSSIYYRHQDLPLRTSLRNSYRLSIGLTFAPGDFNLPVF
jgi:hypothetical protein